MRNMWHNSKSIYQNLVCMLLYCFLFVRLLHCKVIGGGVHTSDGMLKKMQLLPAVH